jgi:hypothetical protein
VCLRNICINTLHKGDDDDDNDDDGGDDDDDDDNNNNNNNNNNNIMVSPVWRGFPSYKTKFSTCPSL